MDDDETDDSFKSSYRNDLVLESKTYVRIPITGIYHVSAAVPIYGINTTVGKTNTLLPTPMSLELKYFPQVLISIFRLPVEIINRSVFKSHLKAGNQ